MIVVDASAGVLGLLNDGDARAYLSNEPFACPDLADSELVGGFRLRLILANDRPSITPYDQDLWSIRLRYSEVDVRDALEQFTVVRRANMRLWANLTPADLMRVGVHGERGEETVEHLRTLYAAHDLLHLRQLDRIRASLV